MREIIFKNDIQECKGFAQFIDGVLWLHVNGKTFTHDFLARNRKNKDSSLPERGEITAPLPGRISKILIEENWEVDAQTPVLVIETMKMEYTLLAKKKGIIENLLCLEGQTITAGQLLLTIK